MTKTMEVNEQNEDEMILVVVGDDGTKKYETSEDLEHSESMCVPISVKIEPIEDAKSLYCTEDVRDIFPIAVNDADHRESIEVEPDIEELDEEYLSQEDYLDEELIEDDGDTKKIETDVSQKKRTPRKTQHEYLLDEEDAHLSPKNKKRKRIAVSSKNKKRETNVTIKTRASKKEPVDDEDFFEIEYLEDGIVSPKKVPKKTTISDDDLTEIEFLNVSSKILKRKKKVSPEKCAPTKIPTSDEEFLEIEYLDDGLRENKTKKSVSPKKHTSKTEEDEEYLPDEEDQEEFIKEEYVRPKRMRNKSSILSRETAPKDKTVQAPRKNRKTNPTKKPTQKTSTRSKKQKSPEKAKKIEKPVIKSFIAELCKKQPVFKEDKEKLVEYIAHLMRKRRPPPPLPNSYILKDDEYSCSYCDVDSPTMAAAGRHYQAAHGPRYLVCFACGDDFRSTANLYKHEKRCRAPDADIQLRARGVFLGRKGRGRPYLTKNKYRPKSPEVPEIPQEKPTKFYCPHCPAVYCRNGLLKEHMHKHTGFRPFQCHECPAAYVSRHQLNKHAKKHSDEQYICDHCGKVLKMKASLISHMDTHLPRPRYGCGRCGRRYAVRSAVKVHIMRDHMHLPPPAACPVCPKRYNRMSHVKSHMKKDHRLILMTKNAILRNLPYMKLEDLEGAQVVFNTNENQIIYSNSEAEIHPDNITKDSTILQT